VRVRSLFSCRDSCIGAAYPSISPTRRVMDADRM
jgi:hypothetical protein